MRLLRCFSLLLLITGLAVCAPRAQAGYGDECRPAGYPTHFDKWIKRAVRKHWPREWQGMWCAYRAQLAKESSLSAETCRQDNPAGARCIAQLLAGTARDIERETGYRYTRTNAKAAIYAGAYYTGKLATRAFTEPRDALCLFEVVLMAYISGQGHVYGAQAVAREHGYIARCYGEIELFLEHVVSEASARDVREYVLTIRRLTAQMTP